MASREEYIDKLEKQLREWNDQIDELQQQAATESKEIKAKLSKRMDEMKKKRAELRTKLNKIKESGDEAFDAIKDDTERLWQDVKKGFSEIRSIINE